MDDEDSCLQNDFILHLKVKVGSACYVILLWCYSIWSIFFTRIICTSTGKNAIIHVERPLSKDSFAHTTMEFKSITLYSCDQLSGESTKTILRKKVFSRKQSKTTQCPFKDIQNESYSYSIRATPISIETLPTTPMFISKLSNFYQGMR